MRNRKQHSDASEEIKQDAYRVISEKLQEAHKIIAECQQLADETGASFSFDLAYGMGGTYHGDDRGWVSSSANC